ncbi:DNRLRE domain-containing protein [Chloroflexus sp.]|uniref:DNRLRE domain-containing protein n=1 Tax=Chloroflexus sp. TaxID=1904827 RepID=UPI00298F2530|nr:DNRLRE domain-containing protein [Chloroflexus sp.]MDW8403102.1 DNRLRE domain-containing protein [Chloroflexus sp.]
MVHRPLRLGLLFLIVLAIILPLTITTANNPPFRQWLPAVFGPPSAPQYLVNAPYFPETNVTTERFDEMAIFWFGQVNRTSNYTDVRVAYNNEALYLYLAIFDRQLWYDTTPSAADLTAWDAATVLVDTGNGTQLSATSYRLVAQFRGPPEPNASYQLSQRANGGSWSAANVAFTTIPGWRGDALNNDNDEDRGWAMTFRIPFASLGLAGRPADGVQWRLGVIVHDRDNAAGTPIADQVWPPQLNPNLPHTWGGLRFGLPVYTPPPVSATQEFRIRHGLNGVAVADAGVGGQDSNMCNADGNFWDRWGNWSQPVDKADISVQNQADIADWPCFAKYYLTFPLSSLPAGRTVVSAKLILSQMGNAQPEDARPSLIQAMVVGEDWNPNALTWNNAPLARENVGSGWAGVMFGPPDWSNLPKREIDVTRGVAQAYANGQPLRLALYSADGAYHSGKYFVTSRTGDWNAQNRPTLVVVLSRP